MKVQSMYPIIVSENAEKAVEFYATLGFTNKQALTTGMGSQVYIIDNGNLELEIMEAVNYEPSPFLAGFYGLRFNVDDINVAVETIKQNGGTIIAGPIDAATSKILMVKDVDGNNVMFMEPNEK